MDDIWHPAERWSGAEREAWQEQRLREVVGAALTHATALGDRLTTAGLDPGGLTLGTLGRLPVLRKDSLPEAQRQAPPFAGWLGAPLADLGRVFRSPGPIFDPEGRDDDYWRFAPALFAAGICPGDLVLNTLSYHLTPAGHMLDGALRAMRCPVVPAGPGNTEAQVRLLADLPVRGYVGTPSFLATLLDAAEAAGAGIGLRVAFVIAEMLPESLRRRLEERHRFRISQGYGTADVGSIAYECPERTGMHIWHESIVEVVDPSTGASCAAGEPGEVVVTALNPVYPLVRFGTGDMAILADGPCTCGRAGRRLARIVGRVGDAVKVRGMFVHPAEVDRVLTRFTEIARYQVVVTRPGHTDEMLVRVEVSEGAAASQGLAGQVRQALVEGLRLRCDVEIVGSGTLATDARKIVDLRRWD